MDGMEIIGNEVRPLPVTIYGSPQSKETELVRARLNDFRIPFVEINVDENETAARYVETINHGERLTPTIVFGDEDFIIVQPTRSELDQALRRAGYGL